MLTNILCNKSLVTDLLMDQWLRKLKVGNHLITCQKQECQPQTSNLNFAKAGTSRHKMIEEDTVNIPEDGEVNLKDLDQELKRQKYLQVPY